MHVNPFVCFQDCLNQETKTSGKCCRDPNYKDPWPSANLINGEDNGQYREDPALGQYAIDKQRLTRSDNPNFSDFVNAPRPVANRQCGIRHSVRIRNTDEQFDSVFFSSIFTISFQNTKPKGEAPLDANFGEYPWQAMILRDSTRTLLCGGAIISQNAVLTAAHCVDE